VSSAPTIYWFRRDLRLADNPALVAAVELGSGRVAPVFVVDDGLLAPAGRARVEFLRSTLDALDASLGHRLTVLAGDPAVALVEFARSIGARVIVATADFAPYGRSRDARVSDHAARNGLETHFLDSPYVIPPGTVRTRTGSPCQVFGAFRRGWEPAVAPEPIAAPSRVDWVGGSSLGLDELTTRAARSRPWYFGDLPDDVLPLRPSAGEAAAHEALTRFVERIDAYDVRRDQPALDATSRLSAHLRFGALHPRQVLHAARGDSPAREKLRSELGWREFYADVLWHRPDSARQVVQRSLEHLRVDTDDAAAERFRSWARGETGYPLVDAGMRQLAREGWMHNRVRMVAASFLVKHLHLDWRWGARWFMWRLIDGDLASNQHGWQWCAGTGTDAAPFHRVFNPTLQAERFDAEGRYVRRYVEELADVAAPQCLHPGADGVLLAARYPAPMVDAQAERLEALARFAEARELARVAS
jgi:deoxyribodipyrimidine photo-lyase